MPIPHGDSRVLGLRGRGMDRRGSDRIRRRVPCTFEYEGAAHQALVVDVSAGGLFLQTDTGIALGSELTLRLDDPRYGELELRGRVVRRRFTPAVIARWVRRGVGIQILAAPERYRDVLCDGEPAPDAAWSALQAREPAGDASPAPGGMSLDIAVDAHAVALPPPRREPARARAERRPRRSARGRAHAGARARSRGQPRDRRGDRGAGPPESRGARPRGRARGAAGSPRAALLRRVRRRLLPRAAEPAAAAASWAPPTCVAPTRCSSTTASSTTCSACSRRWAPTRCASRRSSRAASRAGSGRPG